MKRIYQKKKVPARIKKEITGLVEVLPLIPGMGIDKDYHFEKLYGIYLQKYRAKSIKDRNSQMDEKFEDYVSGIVGLGESLNKMKADDFKPSSQVESKDFSKCHHCSSKSVYEMTDIADDTRYVCNGCGAVNVPEKGVIYVFHHETKSEKDVTENT